MHLVIGMDGILGSAILSRLKDGRGTSRRGSGIHFKLGTNPYALPKCEVAYLCAGTKGSQECEGNVKAFRADVDGNIQLAKHLLGNKTFVIFVSSDAVEWGNSAYARNRLLVEMALIMQPNVAVVRPGRFSRESVGPLADLCVMLGMTKAEGLHYWSAQ